MQFLGDAVLAVWFCTEDEFPDTSQKVLMCCDTIMNADVEFPESEGITLLPHIGIGLGACASIMIGAGEVCRGLHGGGTCVPTWEMCVHTWGILRVGQKHGTTSLRSFWYPLVHPLSLYGRFLQIQSLPGTMGICGSVLVCNPRITHPKSGTLGVLFLMGRTLQFHRSFDSPTKCPKLEMRFNMETMGLKISSRMSYRSTLFFVLQYQASAQTSKIQSNGL